MIFINKVGKIVKFAVSIITPPNYPHSEAFREVAETVHYALLELGYDSVLTSRTDYPDRQHIIFGSNLIPFYHPTLSSNSILYNLEQIYMGLPWIQPALLESFRQYSVWDYSHKNIEQLAQIGITNVQYVPIGYVPQLTRIPPVEEDIDVLFFGSLNDRRLHIINSLKEKGVNTEVLFGVYGNERDRLIARSKIVLNMHYYETKIFEVVRVSYLLANQRFVISEFGCDPVEEVEFSPGVVFADYYNLVRTCLDFLSRPEDRRRIAKTGFDIMLQRPETNYLRSAIQTL